MLLSCHCDTVPGVIVGGFWKLWLVRWRRFDGWVGMKGLSVSFEGFGGNGVCHILAGDGVLL